MGHSKNCSGQAGWLVAWCASTNAIHQESSALKSKLPKNARSAAKPLAPWAIEVTAVISILILKIVGSAPVHAVNQQGPKHIERLLNSAWSSGHRLPGEDCTYLTTSICWALLGHSPHSASSHGSSYSFATCVYHVYCAASLGCTASLKTSTHFLASDPPTPDFSIADQTAQKFHKLRTFVFFAEHTVTTFAQARLGLGMQSAFRAGSVCSTLAPLATFGVDSNDL